MVLKTKKHILKTTTNALSQVSNQTRARIFKKRVTKTNKKTNLKSEKTKKTTIENDVAMSFCFFYKQKEKKTRKTCLVTKLRTF